VEHCRPKLPLSYKQTSCGGTCVESEERVIRRHVCMYVWVYGSMVLVLAYISDGFLEEYSVTILK
jgi:hypothetical protein